VGGEKGGFNQVVNMVAVRDVCSTVQSEEEYEHVYS